MLQRETVDNKAFAVETKRRSISVVSSYLWLSSEHTNLVQETSYLYILSLILSGSPVVGKV